MERGAGRGHPAGALLPRRLHPAEGDRRDRVLQPQERLRYPVPDGRRDPAHHRRRSPPRRNAHRRHRRPSYLGSEAPLPSPCACGGAQRGLRCRERRVEDRERRLARPRQGPLQLLPPPLPRRPRPAPMAGASLASTAPPPISPIPASSTPPWPPPAAGTGWVYAKRPFKGPEQVFSYLARYTHRIAISDSRITAFDGERGLLPPSQAEDAGAEKAPLRHHHRLGRGVHPPLSAPRPAGRDAPHPLLPNPR